MPYVFGVDGGGTSSRAVLTTTTGQVVHVGRGPGVNYHDVGASQVASTINRLFNEALKEARARREECLGVCLGLAGAGRQVDLDILKPLFNQSFGSEGYLLMSDAEIALVSGTLSEFGLICIAGTGSICYGRSEEGNEGRVGGYGPLLSDDGSGYHIALDSLKNLAHIHDGYEQKTILHDWFLQHLQLKSIEEVIHWINSPKATREKIAALAPLVVRAANEDDPLADQILNQQADRLALNIELLYKKLKFHERVEVVLSGGMFAEASYYRQLVRRKVLYLIPGANVLVPRLEPCLGAVLYAFSISGYELNDDILDVLKRSYREYQQRGLEKAVEKTEPKREYREKYYYQDQINTPQAIKPSSQTQQTVKPQTKQQKPQANSQKNAAEQTAPLKDQTHSENEQKPQPSQPLVSKPDQQSDEPVPIAESKEILSEVVSTPDQPKQEPTEQTKLTEQAKPTENTEVTLAESNQSSDNNIQELDDKKDKNNSARESEEEEFVEELPNKEQTVKEAPKQPKPFRSEFQDLMDHVQPNPRSHQPMPPRSEFKPQFKPPASEAPNPRDPSSQPNPKPDSEIQSEE